MNSYGRCRGRNQVKIAGISVLSFGWWIVGITARSVSGSVSRGLPSSGRQFKGSQRMVSRAYVLRAYVSIFRFLSKSKVSKKECALMFEHSLTRVSCHIAFNSMRCYQTANSQIIVLGLPLRGRQFQGQSMNGIERVRIDISILVDGWQDMLL